jgi:hypothetical protein
MRLAGAKATKISGVVWFFAFSADRLICKLAPHDPTQIPYAATRRQSPA